MLSTGLNFRTLPQYREFKVGSVQGIRLAASKIGEDVVRDFPIEHLEGIISTARRKMQRPRLEIVV